MKSLLRSVLITGTFVIGANSMFAAQASDAWMEHWYKAKFGRNSPREEARQKAERAKAPHAEASREVPPANSWFDQWYKAKYGRNSPAEEARQKAAGK